MVSVEVGAATFGDLKASQPSRPKPLAQAVPEPFEGLLFLVGPCEDEPWQRVAEAVSPATELDPIPLMRPLLEVQHDFESVEGCRRRANPGPPVPAASPTKRPEHPAGQPVPHALAAWHERHGGVRKPEAIQRVIREREASPNPQAAVRGVLIVERGLCKE